MEENAQTPLVEMKDISIAFGGVKAVDHAYIDLYPGEVVGLLGHNGAGKSCLIKILSGAYKRDFGQIFVGGQEARIDNPRHAKHYGIETVYQALALADNVDAASNPSVMVPVFAFTALSMNTRAPSSSLPAPLSSATLT